MNDALFKFMEEGVADELIQDDLPSAKELIKSLENGPQQSEGPPIVMFGSESSPASMSVVIFKAFAIIIGFISQEYLDTLLKMVDGVQIFIVMFLILVIWKIISDPVTNWIIKNVHDAGEGWRDDLINLIFFFSYLLVFIVFGYFSRIVFTFATAFGFDIVSITLRGIIAIVYVYDIYRTASTEIFAKSK